jgi:hypothetical protein
MQQRMRFGLFLTVAFMANCQRAQSEPPFSGTIFIDPDIITASDPTTFESATYSGQGARTMFDRRVNNWIVRNAYLFDASFDDGLTVEIQVNPEDDSESNCGMAISERTENCRARVSIRRELQDCAVSANPKRTNHLPKGHDL